MKFSILVSFTAVIATCSGKRLNRAPLTYAPVPEGMYALPRNANTTTLLDLVKSRPDLSTLASLLPSLSGFEEAFDTPPQWQFTAFLPSNEAFNNTGAYYSTYAKTSKGKHWLGNVLQHHYIPNSQLKTSTFNSTLTRIQTASFLYVSTQIVGGTLTLNNVAKVIEGDLPVTSGVVHIIDHILDPSAQVFEEDLPKAKQGFIAGSCSNPALPYC
ncbi:FAS1 domain-containing protein [Cadophora sp. MPI-SDFR-AT-0126]|nr:FAS1 domain-containing protein [Leotiomycetes sp. MPI-SDFR-AT-0126]